jgi:anti-sigma B factor antagonist
MEIKTENLKRTVLVTVSGEVNSATAPELDQLLRDQIAAGHKNLVVNMQDVSFMSSAGLQALIGAQMKVRRMVPAGNVVLAEVPTRLQETFELVGFHHIFKMYDSNLEAVGSF